MRLRLIVAIAAFAVSSSSRWPERGASRRSPTDRTEPYEVEAHTMRRASSSCRQSTLRRAPRTITPGHHRWQPTSVMPIAGA